MDNWCVFNCVVEVLKLYWELRILELFIFVIVLKCDCKFELVVDYVMFGWII